MDIIHSNISNIHRIITPVRLLLLISFFIISVICAQPSLSQEIVAKVTATTETLPANKKDELRDFPAKLEQYLNSYDWTQGDYPYSIECQIGVFFEDVRTTYEDRYRGRFYINTETGIQYVDKYWDFAYNRDDVLMHNSADFSPLLGLVDYYIYLVLGEEMDNIENLSGTPFFQKALDLCNLGKFCRMPRWWDERAKDVQDILREDHKPFRSLQVQFQQAMFYLEDGNSEDAKGLSLQFFQALEVLSHSDRERVFLVRFYNQNYKDLLNLTKIQDTDMIYQLLLKLDPDHSEYYKSNR